MPSAPKEATKTGLVIDRSQHTIRLTRNFDAPRALVFEAWTRPEHMRCWWDATGEPLSTCEIDLRPGGAFKFVSNRHPELPFAGVYQEISPPDRLVFVAMAATGRVTLRETAGITHMLVEIECQSAEQLDQYLKMGIDTGTAKTLENLAAYLRNRSARVA